MIELSLSDYLTTIKTLKMKKLLSILTIAVVSVLNAQVIIGDAVGTATTKTSVLLEFAKGAGQEKGIIVPYVRTLPTGSALVGGAIILDASVPSGTPGTQARVKFYNGTAWVDLSGQDANLITPVNYMTAQPIGVTETGKAIIGQSTSSADGVLVLESNTKAMVLPTVDNTDQIIKPSPGMLVYINKSGAKRLAVFNGSKWSYWKP